MTEELLKHAQDLYQKGLVNEAIVACENAIAEAPQDSSKAHRQLGDILFTEQKFEDAVKHYQKVIELTPKLAHPYFKLGQICKVQEQWVEAIDYCKRAIALNATNPWFHKVLGELYLAQQQFREADASLQKAIALNPTIQDAYFQLGISSQKQKKNNEAILSFSSVLNLSANHLGAHQRLGDLYSDQREFSKAINHYQKAITIKDSNPFVYAKLARALRRDGQSEKAVSTWQSAIQLSADQYQFHEELGDLLARNDDCEAAIDSYEKAIALNPELSSLKDKLNLALQQKSSKPQSYETAVQDEQPPAGAEHLAPRIVSPGEATQGSEATSNPPEAQPEVQPEESRRQSASDSTPQISTTATQTAAVSPSEPTTNSATQPINLSHAEPETLIQRNRSKSLATKARATSELDLFHSPSPGIGGQSADLQETPISKELKQMVKHGRGDGKSGQSSFETHKRRGAKSASANIGLTKDFQFSAEGVGGYDESIPKPVKKIVLFLLLGFYTAIAITLFLRGLTFLGIFMILIAILTVLIFWGFRQID